MSPAGQEPGAVVVVQSPSGAPEPGLASAGGVTWAEGPLSIAAAPAAMRGLSVGPALVCLLEGVLYDYRGHGHPGDGPLPARSDPAASWLAAAYRRGGRGIFGGLRGDYWALVWDRERREGLVVCDQLGSRAPYWTVRDGIVHVASEVRDLLASLPRAPEPDRLALAHWLMMSVPPDGRTLYAGVNRLPAAHLMALGSEHPRPRRYWEPTYREPRHPSPETVRDEVRAALDVAVARRLARASAPGASAVLLSGGLDSSALAALSVKHVPAISTYSAVFPAHPAVDESAFIDATVTRLGVPNTRLLIEGGSVIEGAARFLDVWRSPPTSPNLFFWIPLLQRAADDGVSVLLDGEGGDEVFGFVPFLLADRLRQGRLFNAVRLASHWPGAQTRPPRRVIVQRLRRFGVRGALPPLTHRLMRAARPLGTYAPAWLPSELAQAWLETECSPFAFKRAGRPRWWAFLVEATTRGNGPSVVFEQARRRDAMAGLEARHPLVDIDLIELILSYDPEMAFDVRYSRPLLRDALSGHLDDNVRLRRGKSFFDAVFHGSLSGPDRERARGLLDPRHAELGSYVDTSALYAELFSQPLDSHSEARQKWALTVWRAVTAELWLRQRTGPPATVTPKTFGERPDRFQVHLPGET